MRSARSAIDTIDQMISYGVDKGILHLYDEAETFSGNGLQIHGQPVVNFGSCSYLGLEMDGRLKEGAKNAIDRYGTQFSASRAYISIQLYSELEALFVDLFGNPCVIAPTTSLAHVANLPVLVADGDAVLMDFQVHQSVQTAAQILKAKGITVELLRHNRMDLLEERLTILQAKHAKIWYLADGIYSMFGDACPINDIYALLDKYESLHFYVDDAHGMSLYGKHGRGYVLDGRPMHAKMVLATSLAKAFATGGAVTVFPSQELARKVRTCGGPLITSGPLQPATLGAAIASAKIHLSPEITILQEELRDRIRYATGLIEQYGLPLVSQPGAAVFFIGLSLPRLGHLLVRRMLEAGYYVNLGMFPAVPMQQAGIRFTITRMHSFEQIKQMIATLAQGFQQLLEEESVTLAQICRAFKISLPAKSRTKNEQPSGASGTALLQVDHYGTIIEVPQKVWDALFVGRGTFDHAGLKTLETIFSEQALPENNWHFDYLLIRDREGEVVLATFLTTALWKDDMLAPAAVSEVVERTRLAQPYYLTNTVTMTGSLLTEGEHVFIRYEHPRWQQALQLLLEQVFDLQERYGANHVLIRDFVQYHPDIDRIMADRGLLKREMPDNHIAAVNWKDPQDYYISLSRRSRQHFREDIRKHQNKFHVQVITEQISPSVREYWYQLYENVKERSLVLNTFALPPKFFEAIFDNSHWEVLTLDLETSGGEQTETAGMVVCYKTGDAYIPMVIGLDYTANKKYKVYRQALYQVLLRAAALDKKEVFFGFAASVEKKKMGARPQAVHAYWMSKDTYALQLLSELKDGVTGRADKKV